MKKILFLLTVVVFAATTSFGQIILKDSIRFSGVVMDKDSLTPLPYCTFVISKSLSGISNEKGRFVFWANRKDTVDFSYIGYKSSRFVVSDTLQLKEYLIGIFLAIDTLNLQQVVILPRSNPKLLEYQLKQTMIDKNYQNAANNLNLANYQAKTQTTFNEKWDANDNQKNVAQQQQNSAYYRGQMGPDKFMSITALIPLGVLTIKSLTQKETKGFEINNQEETQILNQYKQKKQKIIIR